MQAAATTTVTLSFRNTGTKTWTKGVAGSQVTLAINGDSAAYSNMGMNVGWPSANRVAVQNEAVIGPGGTATFTFTTRAPFAAGTVSLPLRLVVDGVAWLADQGVFVPIAPSTPGTYAINLRPVIDGVTWMEDEGVFLYVSVIP